MRVLVVEDQADLRESIARRLRGRGCAVDLTGELAEAETFLRVSEYAVVVLDRMLPDGDAVLHLARWRRQGDTVPVLLLTARDRVEDRVEGLEAGADDYLVKPFAMEELLARVAALARRREFAQPTVIQVSDLVVDLGRREVRRAGTLLPLRPKEFAVLELLATRPGQTFSRIELLEGCWDEAREPSSNVEEVVIASLRRKLGDPPLIHTVRGAGYRLDEGRS